ncbi:MAG: M23 family metallopeptidase [Acidimicrobiaceae bacterium]|nr:M23 family metallopeptidase [Acidimicrobiaceae bacterium]
MLLSTFAPAKFVSCVLVSPIATPHVASIIDPFRQPSCERCAGNRGIEYSTKIGTPIVASANGIISFYGMVGGKRYLVIRTNAGRRLTYGSIANSTLRTGDDVLAGQIIGTTGSVLYFGVRENSIQGYIYVDVYVDPAKYLSQNTQTSHRAILVNGLARQLTSQLTSQLARQDSSC